MNDNFNKSAIWSIIYTLLKDKEITDYENFSSKKDDIALEAYKFIKNEKIFIHLADKKDLINHMLDEFQKLFFENNLLKENKFLSELKNIINEVDEKDKNKIFDLVLKNTLTDKKITKNEKEVLHQLAYCFNMELEDLEKFIKKKISEFKKVKDKKDIKVRNISAYVGFSIALILILVSAALIYKVKVYDKKLLLKKINISNIVYKRIYFNKYIVAGNAYQGDIVENTSTTVQKWLGKAVIFYVSGQADIEFNLNDFKYENGVLVYRGKKPNGASEIYPFIIDVNISQKKINKVYEKQPHEITPNEAKIPAKAVGLVTAVGGGYIGAKLGSKIGKFFPIGGNPIIGKIVGIVAGGGIGAVAGGATGYLATKKILTGLQLTKDINVSDEIIILSKSKELIAAELYSDEQLMIQLKNDFEKYVKGYFSKFGLPVTKIKYTLNDI